MDRFTNSHHADPLGGSSSEAPTGMCDLMSLRFISINARGLNTQFKRSAVRKEAHKQKADLLFIQETHFVNSKYNHLKMKSFPHIYYSNAASKKRGGPASNQRLRDLPGAKTPYGPQWSLHYLNMRPKRATVHPINLYSPNSNQIHFLSSLMSKIQKIR